MTRKDYELICRVLADAQRPQDHGLEIPVIPSAEWMRRRIGHELYEAFGLSGEAQRAFLKEAKLTFTVT